MTDYITIDGTPHPVDFIRKLIKESEQKVLLPKLKQSVKVDGVDVSRHQIDDWIAEGMPRAFISRRSYVKLSHLRTRINQKFGSDGQNVYGSV